MRLVILPGMDGTGRLLVPFAEELQARGVDADVLAYPLDETLGYPELVGRIGDQLPHEEPFALLGESFGGPIAISLAQSGAPNLRALVLAVTFAEPPDSFLLRLTERLPVEWILSQPVPCFLAHKLMLGTLRRPERLGDTLCRVIKDVRPQVIADRLKSVREWTPCTATVALPALYLQAIEDTLLPESAVEGVRKLVPGLRVERVHGPHLVLDTAPEECAERVAAFLKGTDLKS